MECPPLNSLKLETENPCDECTGKTVCLEELLTGEKQWKNLVVVIVVLMMAHFYV